ncbi:hypothetical protein [Kribbella soli]|uniref:hypothetical protein n=1 Tax=Kribbella soli TaxID=1124743 RepID=UPI00192D6D54|nr:hypothetical protein [Kribbella soli]
MDAIVGAVTGTLQMPEVLVVGRYRGTQPVAVRFTATAGSLQGFEVTMVTAAVNDVVVAVTVINGLPEDIEGATTTAVEKAQATLGASRSGT